MQVHTQKRSKKTVTGSPCLLLCSFRYSVGAVELRGSFSSPSCRGTTGREERDTREVLQRKKEHLHCADEASPGERERPAVYVHPAVCV